MPDDRTRRSVLQKGALATVAGSGLILGSQSAAAAETSDYTLRVEHVGTEEPIQYGIGINAGDGNAGISAEQVDTNAEFRSNSEYFRVIWATNMGSGDVDIVTCENCEDPDPVLWEPSADHYVVFQDDERIH
ncbi:hypothetical protein [Natrinema salaciae]|uniref:hypothetical protein n=1 Tax=Natrinema salaciae TaxID=1186196 RepID=UPI0011144A7C|nr:hypothetical protein [Natrinema salaciae]